MGRLSLKTRLVVSYASLALVVTGVSTFAIERAATRHLQSAAGERLERLAYEMTDRLDRGMYERHHDLQVLARLDLLADARTPNAQRQALVEELKQSFTTYAWIGFAAPDGRVLASTGGLLEGANVGTREWFRHARHTAFVGDVHEAVLLAKLLPRDGDEPLRFVDVSTPVRDERGRLVGVLGAHLSWSWAREVREALLLPVKNREQIDVLVLARDGTVLLGPPELQGSVLELPILGASGLLRQAVERWSDGETYVTGLSVSQGHRDYPGLGWQVITRQRTDDAFAVVHDFQREVLWAALLITVAFGLLGAWRARTITEPLAHLTRAARRIEEGERDVDLPETGAYQEVTRLSHTLRRMVGTLEAKVAERTHALQASTERAEALSALSRATTLSLPPEAMAAHAAALLKDVCPFDWAGLASVTDEGAELRSVYTRPGTSALTEALAVIPRGQGIVWAALERRAPLFIDDYPAQVQAVPQFVTWGARGAAFLPINAQTGHPHVLVAFRRTQRSWTAEERTLLDAASGVLGIAFERRAHEQYLEQAALEDRLTGLRNRRAFDLDLEAAHGAARRHGHALAVIMIDLDGLKQINDQEGHERGDALLRAFGVALGQTFRVSDRTYRLGGDEYALLLTHTPLDASSTLHGRVAEAEERTRAAGFPTMGASAGIAFFPSDRDTPSDLVRLADERMYEQKRRRRAARQPS